LAPLDRIRQALKDPERIAAFDRAFAAYADRIEQIANGNVSAEPLLGARFNSGKFIEARVERDERFHA
jgi:hypothetical protein